jgi:thiosulfate reductase/polysulfide reductase chain A
VEEGGQPVFDTPSGKVEFWSDQRAAKGHDAVPAYTRHPLPPAGRLHPVTGRSPVHAFSRTRSNPLLLDPVPDDEV